MKQAILFLSNKSDEWTIHKFNSLSVTGDHSTNVFFLYHQQNEIIPETIRKLNHYTFSNGILHELGYTPIRESILPGSNHFPLLKFFLENKEYDYFWLIEDDVSFNGRWKDLFLAFKNNKSDFISTIIKRHEESPQWDWWHSLTTPPEEIISDKDKIRSFNPIYRLSNQSLECIDTTLKKGWSGHHEVLIPTLLHHHHFTILDMGESRYFVSKDYKQQFYTEGITMSHLPIQLGNIPNYIYHPVKEKKRIAPASLKKNCVISAVGKTSLHRVWIKESPEFDLHLIIYDDSFNKFYNDTDFISCGKGYKFQLVYDYLMRNPEYIDRYDYFFLPDDDISMDAGTISKLFRTMKKYNLHIAQPALSDSYYTYEHTLRNRFCYLRYTNFVEMMVPCFSNEAFRKVYTTFNKNKSGWGIDFHWAQLIGFSGKEMAIIDAVPVVHTRPVQSFNTKNENDLSQYTKRHKLSQKIVETDFVPIAPATINESEPFIGDRILYEGLKSQIICLFRKTIESLYTIKNLPMGINGLMGISLFLTNYSLISEKRKDLEIGLSLTDRIIEHAVLLKDDLRFKSGVPGLGWYVEYLARQKFIANETDDILEVPCTYLNNYFLENKKCLNVNDLIEFAPHYLARVENSFHTNMELHNTEKKILAQILCMLSRWYNTLSIREQDPDQKKRMNCLSLLCQGQRVMAVPQIRSTLEKAATDFIYLNSGTKPLSLLNNYLFLHISEAIGNKEIRNQAISNIIHWKSNSEESLLPQIFNLYFLYRIHQQTKEEKVRNHALQIINQLIVPKEPPKKKINKLWEKENFQECNSLIIVGIILQAILSNKNIEFDSYIFREALETQIE